MESWEPQAVEFTWLRHTRFLSDSHLLVPHMATSGITLCKGPIEVMPPSNRPAPPNESFPLHSIIPEDPILLILVKKDCRHHLVTHYTFIVHFHNLDAPQNWGHGEGEEGRQGTLG